MEAQKQLICSKSFGNFLALWHKTQRSFAVLSFACAIAKAVVSRSVVSTDWSIEENTLHWVLVVD